MRPKMKITDLMVAMSGRTPRIMGMTPDRQRIKQTKPFMMEHPVSAQK
jgi:hypothetical protein